MTDREMQERMDALGRRLADVESHAGALRREVDFLRRRHNFFSGHYTVWQEKRVTHIIERYGHRWFQGKRGLELACGYGDIGIYFRMAGADMTFSDARQEHLDVITAQRPHLRTVRADIEREWPFEGRFDFILHLGVLYHLKDWRFSLAQSVRNASRVILETIVVDAEDDAFEFVVDEDARASDTAFSGQAARFSAATVEKELRSLGARFEMIKDPRLNSTVHCYDWEPKNTRQATGGQRRFWYIECP